VIDETPKSERAPKWKRKPRLDPNKAADVAVAPAVGFEPTTNRLTADRSTTELRWILVGGVKGVYLASEAATGKCFVRR
jgi:hypothetical protein